VIYRTFLMNTKKRARQELPPILQRAVNDFNAWSDRQLLANDESSKITAPLYHYTDAAGLVLPS